MNLSRTCLLPAILAALASPALAQPVTLAHSGYLLDGSDQPIDGATPMRFRILDAATSGNELWLGDAGGGNACSVAVSHGYYAVVLGGGGGCGTGLTATILPTGQARWLEVEVNDVALTPRQAIAAVPTAVTSADAQALKAALAAGAGVNTPTNPVDWTALKGVPANVLAATPYAAGTGLSLTGNSFSLASTGVAPGTYTNATVTVDASGRVTSIANGVSQAASTSLPSPSPAGQLVYATDLGRLMYSNGSAWLDTFPATPPSIASISQATVAQGQNVTITISGSGFASGATVKFGTTTSPSVTVVSSNTITAATGTSLPLGVHDIVVTNPSTQSATLSQGFAVHGGLLGHYDMSTIVGTTLKDLSGNLRDGTITTGIEGNIVGGRVGSALNMNNAGKVTLPASTGVTGNAARSVCVWVKAGTGGGYAFGAGTDGTVGATFNSRFSANGTPGFMGWANHHDPSSGPFVMDNSWHFMIYTYDGTNLVAYADNNQAWTVTKSLSTGSGAPLIGSHSGGGIFFPGALDEYRYYNRVLTAAERSFLWNGGAGR